MPGSPPGLPPHADVQGARPGITGLWQITKRGEGRLLHECVDLDLRYIDELSPRMDLRILLRTPAALLRNRSVI